MQFISTLVCSCDGEKSPTKPQQHGRMSILQCWWQKNSFENSQLKQSEEKNLKCGSGRFYYLCLVLLSSLLFCYRGTRAKQATISDSTIFPLLPSSTIPSKPLKIISVMLFLRLQTEKKCFGSPNAVFEIWNIIWGLFLFFFFSPFIVALVKTTRIAIIVLTMELSQHNLKWSSEAHSRLIL